MRIALIGLGHLGKIHFKLLSEIQNESSDLVISGVLDIDTDLTKTIATEFKVNPFSNLNELIKNSDSAIIVTPTSTHFEIAKELISNGLNVFIEKPVTNSIANADELLQLEKRHQVIIQVGHIERFNPAILAIEKYNVTPIFIESHRLSQFNPRGTDVSVIADLMIHDIDLILYLVKSKVESVDANGASIITAKIDIANARIKFSNGCVANVTASRISQQKMRKMRIFQKNAYISIDFLQNLSEIFKLVGKDEKSSGIGEIPITEDKRIIYERAATEQVNPMKMELYSFINSVKNKTTPAVTLEEGVTALKVAAQVVESVENSISKIKT